MDSDAVPTASALFGADGTQLPDPLPAPPDALTGPEHTAWSDALLPGALLPGAAWSGAAGSAAPVPSPLLPDGRAMQAAIAAVLADDPAVPPAAPAWRPAAPSGFGPPRLPLPAGASRAVPAPPAGLRRRSGQESARTLQRRSSGGVRAGFIIALTIIGVVSFYLVIAVVQAISALFS